MPPLDHTALFWGACTLLFLPSHSIFPKEWPLVPPLLPTVIQLMNRNIPSWIEPWSLRNFQLKAQQLRWGEWNHFNLLLELQGWSFLGTGSRWKWPLCHGKCDKWTFVGSAESAGMFIPTGIDGSQSGSSFQASWSWYFCYFIHDIVNLGVFLYLVVWIVKEKSEKKSLKICQVQHLSSLELWKWKKLEWSSRFW